MTDYLLPITGDPDEKEISYLKHPLQTFLRRFLRQWVEVKISRDHKNLIIKNYSGPIDRLAEGISRQIKAWHARPRPDIAPKLTKLEAIVEETEETEAEVETDETLKRDIEVLYRVLATDQELHEQEVAGLKNELHKLEGEYKFLNIDHEKTKQNLREANTQLENGEKAIKGLSDNYSRKSERVKELEKRLEELSKTATPHVFRLSKVKQSAGSIKVCEQELQSILGSYSLDELLCISDAALVYVNEKLGTSFASEEELQTAAKFTPTAVDEQCMQNYKNAQKTINFYEAITASGVEPPEELKAMISQLEASLKEKKTIIENFEAESIKQSEAIAKAAKIQELIDKHAKSVAMKKAMSRAPTIEIYVRTEGNTHTAYLPVGAKDSIIYNAVKSYLSGEPVIDDSGIIVQTIDSIDKVMQIKSALQKNFSKVVVQQDITY